MNFYISTKFAFPEIWVARSDTYDEYMAGRMDFPYGPEGDLLWAKLTEGMPTRERDTDDE